MIKEIIKSLEYKSLSAEQVYEKLNEKTIVFIDEEFWTWAGIADIIGNVGAEHLRVALSEGGMGWAVHQLGGKGLVLSREDIQAALYYLNSLNVPGMENLALHVKKNISILEKNNISTTIEEVQDIINEINLEDLKKSKIDEALDRLYNYKINITSWSGDLENEPKL
jgi:hypothetical protein